MAATRKLYIELAITLGRQDAPTALVDALAADLKQDNIRFDRTRFIEAVEDNRPAHKEDAR